MENNFDIRNASLLQLASRLNEINQEIDSLIIEYNDVIAEIKKRTPQLSEDPNLTPKVKMKKLQFDSWGSEEYCVKDKK